jgi:hypothetical protein
LYYISTTSTRFCAYYSTHSIYVVNIQLHGSNGNVTHSTVGGSPSTGTTRNKVDHLGTRSEFNVNETLTVRDSDGRNSQTYVLIVPEQKGNEHLQLTSGGLQLLAGRSLVTSVDTSGNTVVLSGYVVESPVGLSDETLFGFLLTNATLPSGKLVRGNTVLTVSYGRVDCILIERIRYTILS